MSAVCPEGHTSQDPEYCSVCGAKIGAAAGPRGATAASAPAASSADTCPSCEAAREPTDKFCEVCGYDFVTGTLPTAPRTQEAAPVAAASAPPVAVSAWWAVVSADRDFYDRNDSNEVQFPLGAPDRNFQLTAERVTIGRRSRSRGVEPTIDLADPPEDAAISHNHATLLRQSDGSYTLVDNGSTNGTYMKGNGSAMTPNTPVALAAGDHFNLGAWTKITIEHRDPSADPTSRRTS